MTDFLIAAVSPFNLPFTLLMVLLVFYWLAVILGAADAEWVPDFDLDVEDGGGFFSAVLNTLNIGEVPFMAVISIMVLSAWCFSMLTNYYLNPHGSVLWGTLLLLLNLVISFGITVGLVRLVIRFMGPISARNTEDQQILYRVGTVVTSEVTPAFGRISIETRGAPIVVQARTPEGVILIKGEKALVYDEDRETGIYLVDQYENQS